MIARLNDALLARLAARQSEDGQTMAEYGLLLALIALAVIGAATALGGAIDTKFDEVVSKL